MIDKFTIFGERCSGTNFLENAMEQNFKLTKTWEYGWKHFFGHKEYTNCDDTLFIGLVRHPIDWLCSFKANPHHLASHMRSNWNNFLLSECWSYNDIIRNGKTEAENEIMEDHHIHTKERYKNIFEMRQVKTQYLLNEMPSKVKNFILIKYEDLRDDYNGILDKIRAKFNLVRKSKQYIRINDYKGLKTMKFTKKIYKVEKVNLDIIKKNIDINVENALGYII